VRRPIEGHRAPVSPVAPHHGLAMAGGAAHLGHQMWPSHQDLRHALVHDKANLSHILVNLAHQGLITLMKNPGVLVEAVDLIGSRWHYPLETGTRPATQSTTRSPIMITVA
jgi:hypothetical protein